ncbi:MAG TPA: methyl-accepting chemotaxis protein, partial [Anaeromyxobacteraceae bacterium]
MARSPKEDRNERPSARGGSAPHLLALRGRPALTPPPRPLPASAVSVSLQTKILVSYVVLGVVLYLVVPELQARLASRAAAAALVVGVTLAVGYGLTVALARVDRLVRLKASAQEISAGDLSRPVTDQGATRLHDEVDDLTLAIRTMQENLQDLVSRIQRTAQSVAESANDLQRSAEDVNGSTDEVARSMENIAKGAEE